MIKVTTAIVVMATFTTGTIEALRMITLVTFATVTVTKVTDTMVVPKQEKEVSI